MQQHPFGASPPSAPPPAQERGLEEAQAGGHAELSEQQAALQQALKEFWEQQNEEVQQVGTEIQEFKNHQLPLARIKKIMKSDEDVRMISAEAPVLFAKACEMFILDLTLRSWSHAEDSRRRTLQKSDVAGAIASTEILDFLLDIVPKEDLPKEEPRGASGGGMSAGGAAAASDPLGAGTSAAGTAGGAGVPPAGMPFAFSRTGAMLSGGPLDAMFQQAQQAAGLLGAYGGGSGQAGAHGLSLESSPAAEAFSKQ